MTRMLKDAHDLLNRVPEDKLPFLVEIMKGINGLYPDDEEPEVSEEERMAAFETLERMRKSIPHLDYNKELASWREEKFGYARAN